MWRLSRRRRNVWCVGGSNIAVALNEHMPKPDAWMPFYPGDYLADTRRLSLEHHGAYLLLILDYWRNGPPPSDDATLAQIVGCTAATWRRLSSVIRPLFREEDGRLRHKRIDAELAGATERAEKAHGKAVVAAAARWSKHQSEHATSNAPSMPQAMHEDCPSQSPSPVPPLREEGVPSKKRKARKPETPIPDDFAISERVRSWAEKGGHTDILQAAFETFVGRNQASGKRYADWDQALMNAVREDWYGLKGKVNGKAVATAAQWWTSEAGTTAKGAELGLRPRNGESWNDFRGRIRERLGQ